MANVLSQFGNIPVTAVTVGSVFPSLTEKNKKVRWLEKHDEIIRLKRGLYVVNPEITGKTLSTELMPTISMLRHTSPCPPPYVTMD